MKNTDLLLQSLLVWGLLVCSTSYNSQYTQRHQLNVHGGLGRSHRLQVKRASGDERLSEMLIYNTTFVSSVSGEISFLKELVKYDVDSMDDKHSGSGLHKYQSSSVSASVDKLHGNTTATNPTWVDPESPEELASFIKQISEISTNRVTSTNRPQVARKSGGVRSGSTNAWKRTMQALRQRNEAAANTLDVEAIVVTELMRQIEQHVTKADKIPMATTANAFENYAYAAQLSVFCERVYELFHTRRDFLFSSRVDQQRYALGEACAGSSLRRSAPWFMRVCLS